MPQKAKVTQSEWQILGGDLAFRKDGGRTELGGRGFGHGWVVLTGTSIVSGRVFLLAVILAYIKFVLLTSSLLPFQF